MAHDPKAQDATAEFFYYKHGIDRRGAEFDAAELLGWLADAGLAVVSDAAEPADAEQRAAAFEAAQHRQTFTP